MSCTIYPESKRGELGTEPVSLQTAILIFWYRVNRFSNLVPRVSQMRDPRNEVVVFRRLVASTKCWLDLQLLNAGIRTGVIVVFYPLSDKFELTYTWELTTCDSYWKHSYCWYRFWSMCCLGLYLLGSNKSSNIEFQSEFTLPLYISDLVCQWYGNKSGALCF